MSARAGAALAMALLLGACATQKTSLNSDTFDARKKLARELANRGDWTPAFAYADALHRERPRDVDVLVLRGTIYRERALWVESESDLKDALMIDDRDAEAHAALGILYDVTQRPAQAEAEHRRAVKLAPDTAGYLNNLGFSLFLRGKPRDAIPFYEKAASLEPTSRRVRTNLGFACAATGDLRRAAHEFEMGGTPAEAKNNLGFAYERRGDLVHAFDLYREAIELDPKSMHARSNLVHAAQALGRDVPVSATVPVAETVVPVKTAAVPAPTVSSPASTAPAAPPPSTSQAPQEGRP
ncbi:MAG TPA: tetratricopeptide repeat protein [Polyangia bacterium]|nr:tetratricopeptide repeat protein [Polyangia bacterium]